MIEIFTVIIICLTVLSGIIIVRDVILKCFSLFAPIKIDITKEMKTDIDEIKTRLSGIELQRGISVRRQ